MKSDKIVNIFALSNYSFDENHNSNFEIYNKSSNRTFGIGGGTVVFFNNSIGLELSFEYKSSNRNSAVRENGLQMNLGFQVHLEK